MAAARPALLYDNRIFQHPDPAGPAGALSRPRTNPSRRPPAEPPRPSDQPLPSPRPRRTRKPPPHAAARRALPRLHLTPAEHTGAARPPPGPALEAGSTDDDRRTLQNRRRCLCFSPLDIPNFGALGVCSGRLGEVQDPPAVVIREAAPAWEAGELPVGGDDRRGPWLRGRAGPLQVRLNSPDRLSHRAGELLPRGTAAVIEGRLPLG